MSLPTDVARQVSEHVPQPGFDTVVERARAARRRRRTTAAAGIAAAVVVAGMGWTAGTVGSDGHRSPEPARPAPSTPWDGSPSVDRRLPDDVQEILRGDDLHPWSVVGSGDGVAVLWRSCPDGGPCRFAVVARTGDAVVGVDLGDVMPQVSAVPDGWALERALYYETLTRDGRQQVLTDTGSGNTDLMPGDAVVAGRLGPRLVRGTEVLDLPGARAWKPTSAHVTDSGRVVLAPDVPGPRRVVVSDDGSRWRMTHVADPSEDSTGTGLLAGNGDHLAYALLGDDPDGSIPVTEVAVSSDAGETWTVAGLDPGALVNLSSLAVSPQGTTYLTVDDLGVVRIDTDGNPQVIAFSSHDTSAFVTDDEVCVVAEAGAVDHLQCSSDDGRSWAPQALPGFE